MQAKKLRLKHERALAGARTWPRAKSWQHDGSSPGGLP